MVLLPPHQHVVARHVVLVPDRGERRHSDPQPGEVIEHGDADAAGLHHEAGAAGHRLGAGEGRVEAERGDGNAEAVRADQTHPVPAASGQEPGAVLGVDPCRYHHQGADTAAAAVLGDCVDVRGRHGDNGDIRRFRQVGDGRDAGDAQDGRRVRVDGEDAARKAGGNDVPQDRVANPAWVAAGADNRDGGRLEQMAQAGDIGELLAHRQ